jgi:hypothetical protein
MCRRRVLILAAFLGFALPTLLSGAPASATLLDRVDFHGENSGVMHDFCGEPGFTVEFEHVFDGTISVRSHGPDGLVFNALHSSSSQTFMNPANDLSVLTQPRPSTRTSTSSTTVTAP